MTVTLLEWNGGGGTQNQIRLLTKQAWQWHGGSYSSIRVSTEFKDILSALLTFLLLPGHHFVRCNCTTTQVNPLRYISNGLIHWWQLNSNVWEIKTDLRPAVWMKPESHFFALMTVKSCSPTANEGHASHCTSMHYLRASWNTKHFTWQCTRSWTGSEIVKEWPEA